MPSKRGPGRPRKVGRPSLKSKSKRVPKKVGRPKTTPGKPGRPRKKPARRGPSRDYRRVKFTEDGKIINPVTGRKVSPSSKLGKDIINHGTKTFSRQYKRSKAAKESNVGKKVAYKRCPKRQFNTKKVCNPATGRWLKRSNPKAQFILSKGGYEEFIQKYKQLKKLLKTLKK